MEKQKQCEAIKYSSRHAGMKRKRRSTVPAPPARRPLFAAARRGPGGAMADCALAASCSGHPGT